MKPTAPPHRVNTAHGPPEPILTVGLPSPDEELLLRAALLPGEAALQAWREWSAQGHREDELPMASQLLFPLLHHNLHPLGVGDVRSGKIMGVCRRIWWGNQGSFHALADILRLFNDAGIPTIILKGAALTLRYYQDRGLRPMGDFDVQVPAAKRRQAIEVLARAGWRTRHQDIAQLTDSVLNVWHAQMFQDSRRRPVDLHWHTLQHDLTAESDQDFWEGAVPVELEGIPSMVLNPTDQLIHVCVHGASAGDVIRVRWVADAAMIFRAGGDELDWGRLIDITKRRRFTLPMRRALGYLQEKFGFPVPGHVLEKLARNPISKLERAYYASSMADPARLWGGGLYHSWCRHRLVLERRGISHPAATWLGFPRFLQNRQSLSNREFIAWLVARVCTRIGSGLQRRIGS